MSTIIESEIEQTVVGKATDVRFEHLRTALGIGNDRPRLSWHVETQQAGWLQAGYEIEAYAPGETRPGQTVRVDSAESVLVDWPFAPLASRERVQVRVRARNQNRQVTSWSEPAAVEAGLLAPEDWSARLVTPHRGSAPSPAGPAPLIRRAFRLNSAIKRARLYITALGVYEASINGVAVGDHVLAPGWTSYHHRLRYQTYDVTQLLQGGENVIGVILGNGWFHGRFGFGGGRRHIYGDKLALLAQLEVTYSDGSSVHINTDEQWRASAGPVLANEIYDGETYDARLEQVGWDRPDYDAGDWTTVQFHDWDMTTLVAPLGPPVRRTQVLEPATIIQSPSGRTIVDFGQNLVGWLRIKVRGPAGHTITLRHAEVLEDGELCVRPLRTAEATDNYTLKGKGTETWEPRFTFHGFRYAEVQDWPGELTNNDVRAIVCHSDLERTGWFTCSDPLLNQLHENALWSMRGNFLDVPTDCPQRDERMGWTGDIQVFSPAASFLYDVSGFLASWLKDLTAEQQASGVVPFTVPDILPGTQPPAAAWGDAAVFVPWVIYQRYGDGKILADQFDSMCAWVDLLESVAGDNRLWDTGFQFGDWLDPAAPPERPAAALTSSALIATAYFARSAELLGLAAGVLGRTREEAHYLNLAREVREAFNRAYVTPAGNLLSDSATAYALALQFALLPDEGQRRQAGQRLASVIRSNGYRISTGFVGTPLVCDALCTSGQEDAAFRLLMTKDNPSWLYPVTMGATTIWERWDSLLPDGSVNPGKMTSFNHYALGAVVDWLQRTVGGLAAAAPGYRRLLVRPRPGGGLSQASAMHITPYGLASCAWRIDDGKMTVAVNIPPNTVADVVLPGKRTDDTFEVPSGSYEWAYAYSDPRHRRPKLTVDSLIRDLIDDGEAGPQLIATIRSFGTELADQVLSQEGSLLREAVAFLPRHRQILESVNNFLASIEQRSN